MSVDNLKTSGLVTIRQVTMSILNRIRDYSMNDYEYLAQLVIEGFSELNMFHISNLEVAYLTMNSQKIVDLPSDYITYSKIGVPMDGKIYILTKNDSMIPPRDIECGETINNVESSRVSGGYYFINHYNNRGQYVAGLYGMGGGLNASYYRIDRERRQIFFSDDIAQSEVILEYKSTGVNLSGKTLIPYQAVPALRAYVMWTRVEYDPRVPAIDKKRKKDLYDEEVHRLRDIETIPTVEEFLDSLYEDVKQTIKR